MKWHPTFTDYFTTHLKPAIFDNLENLNRTDYPHFQSKVITSNLSESWHSKLQKQFTKAEREPMRVDHLVVSLFTIQTSFLDEYNRSVDDDGGTYTMKKNAFKRNVKLDLDDALPKVNDIMQQVKEEVKNMPEKETIDGAENTLEIGLAKLVEDLHMIHFIGPFRSWFVGHPYHRRQVQQVVIEKGSVELFLLNKFDNLFNF